MNGSKEHKLQLECLRSHNANVSDIVCVKTNEKKVYNIYIYIYTARSAPGRSAPGINRNAPGRSAPGIKVYTARSAPGINRSIPYTGGPPQACKAVVTHMCLHPPSY